MLDDGDIVAVSPDRLRVWGGEQGTPQAVQRPVIEVDTGLATVDRGDFPHWMIKEIHDVPPR